LRDKSRSCVAPILALRAWLACGRADLPFFPFLNWQSGGGLARRREAARGVCFKRSGFGGNGEVFGVQDGGRRAGRAEVFGRADCETGWWVGLWFLAY